ncbi:hypothetical protein BUALT_Bualt04G0018700 [Buddleja alternifolia]|uniref:SOSEKI DIX-like domain-containing protein n=1 Tax=Buddleja alternifolia TaxID=168488 RepID=A0AAV6XWT0_9LAMI|nr:hypothetical protein BUALT_Bualt04G0018700 [Buddleja alternifolia]
MEISSSGVQGRRICRERCSPDSADQSSKGKAGAIRMITSSKPTFKKVQVVYYLSRNGLLEHPHYMEVTHLAHHPLRLKDVIDRLTVLRGKGMPSLYSWSCKRFILEIEKMSHLQVSNIVQVQDSNFQPKRKSVALKRRIEPEEMMNNQYYHDNEDHEQNQEDDEEEYEDEKTSYPRCSRGVSTDEIEEFKQDTNSFSSPPSTTSSTLSEKPNNSILITTNNNNSNNNTSCNKIFEDGDPVGNEPLLSRNSMLLNLIACGGSTSFRKSLPPPSPPCAVVGRKSGCGDLYKGVVCRAAEAEEEVMMIGCMSENPRFGNLQSEEKEYFSGSIVESITTHQRNQPGLKKSSSHNEERSNISGLGEAAEKEVKKEKGVKGKCIPRKKSSSKQSKK